MGLFCELANQLVAARQRHLLSVGNRFMGIYFEAFCVFDCLPDNGICLYFRYVGGGFYFSRNSAAYALGWRWFNNFWSVFNCKVEKMKKYIFLVIAFFVFTTTAFAQGYQLAAPEQQKELMQNITAASEQMKTLRCDFVQKKTISILSEKMLSEGTMLFKQPNKLCWEYTKPYQYRFTLNGNKIMIGAEKDNRNVINTGSSRLFKEMSKVIVSLINSSGIFDEGKFTATFYVGTQDYQVILTPTQKELKRMFCSITLTFSKTDHTVNTVEIKEVNDDVTFITMKNKQINKELNDEIFAIR